MLFYHTMTVKIIKIFCLFFSESSNPDVCVSAHPASDEPHLSAQPYVVSGGAVRALTDSSGFNRRLRWSNPWSAVPWGEGGGTTGPVS